MLIGVLVLVLTTFLADRLARSLRTRYPFVDQSFLMRLYYYHVLLALVYYLYAMFNPSDSVFYYVKVTSGFRGPTWGDFYGVSTPFIEFIGYPLVNYLKLSYEGVMAVFAFLGFIGFAYFYIFCKENIRFKHTLYGYDLVKIIFFLPNLHFWSSSFGKGSVIFLGISLFFYGISNIRSRWIAICVAGFVIYHVRPHVMLVMLVSSAIGFVFTTKGISIPIRILFLVGVGVAFYYIYGDVLTLVGIDEEEFMSEGLDMSRRARELTKATSAIDINSYSLPLQVFTFLYRPLFFDAPGILGLIVSIENLFYLLVTLKIMNLSGARYLITSSFLVKTALFSFLTVTLALAQISGNLGLAIRQKSQVMILFMFVIISFLDKEKMNEYKLTLKQQVRRMQLSALRREGKG